MLTLTCLNKNVNLWLRLDMLSSCNKLCLKLKKLWASIISVTMYFACLFQAPLPSVIRLTLWVPFAFKISLKWMLAYKMTNSIINVTTNFGIYPSRPSSILAIIGDYWFARHSNNQRHHTSISEQVRLPASLCKWLNLMRKGAQGNSPNQCR